MISPLSAYGFKNFRVHIAVTLPIRYVERNKQASPPEPATRPAARASRPGLALVVAALAGNPLQGAWVMATFAACSGLVLFVAPWALLRWGRSIRIPALGMRLAGLALSVSAGAALYLGLVHNQAPWCVAL